jgi:hypothetical protein
MPKGLALVTGASLAKELAADGRPARRVELLWRWFAT